MNSVICDILKDKLANLTWMERFGGMVSPVSLPEFATDADGKQVIKGYQVYPMACGVNVANCWETGTHKHFEPSSDKAAIGFFVDNGGTSLREVLPPKDSGLKFSFDLKFLCWMNSARLGETITAGGCLPSSRVSPFVIAQLYGNHTAVGKFGGGLEEETFLAIEVTGIRQLTQTPSIFEPFTFARDGVNRHLFTYPYDYFGLQITGTFVVNRNCLPEFGVDWEPEEGCLSPASNPGTPGNGTSNWFFNQMQQYNSGLGAYTDNEAAKTALEVIYGTGNAVGKEYYIAAGSDVAPEGTKMRVV